MILPALLCALGLSTGFLLIRRIPACASFEPSAGPAFSVIIPARDEERNLPRLLESLADSTAGHFEILVVDDGSTDNTAAVAASFGARVLTSAAKPQGWSGKSWACHQGAQSAFGRLLFFIDADTYFLPGGLARVISCWLRERNQRLVISVLPYHTTSRAYEQLSLFFNIMMAAGAGGFGAFAAPRLFGQCLLISKEQYFAAGSHASVRNVVLENLRWASGLSGLWQYSALLRRAWRLAYANVSRRIPADVEKLVESRHSRCRRFGTHRSHPVDSLDFYPLVDHAAVVFPARLWALEFRSGLSLLRAPNKVASSPARLLPHTFLSAFSAAACLLLLCLCKRRSETHTRPENDVEGTRSMRALIWTANLLGWPLIHLTIGFIAVRLPSNFFARDNWLTAPRHCEHHDRFYRDWLAIRRWKSLLPDGAPWLGGFAKKKLDAHDSSYLAQFQLETRCAEHAHWCMLCCLPIFFLWNPPWACLVMSAYALTVNLPCILTQRYNRITLHRLLQIRRRAPARDAILSSMVPGRTGCPSHREPETRCG